MLRKLFCYPLATKTWGAKQWIKRTFVNFICEAKLESEQDILIMVMYVQVSLCNELKPCSPNWLFSLHPLSSLWYIYIYINVKIFIYIIRSLHNSSYAITYVFETSLHNILRFYYTGKLRSGMSPSCYHRQRYLISQYDWTKKGHYGLTFRRYSELFS